MTFATQRRSSPALASSPARRRWPPLLVSAALLVATLACADTDVSYRVEPKPELPDTVVAEFSQHLSQAYLRSAERAEQERKADYEGAGLPYKPLFPMTASGSPIFQSQTNDLTSQGYVVTMDDTGYLATRTYQLADPIAATTWRLRVEVDPNNPDLRTYVFGQTLDLKNVSMDEIDRMTRGGLPPKPPPSSGGSSGGAEGSGLVGGLGSVFSIFTEMLDASSDLDMWYIQRVMQEVGLPRYTYHVSLPGKIFQISVGGQPVGALEDGEATFTMDEAFLRSHAGQSIEWEVRSLYLECGDACTGPHLMIDPAAAGTRCDCVCEKGWELVTGTDACTHCQTVCELRNSEFEPDPDQSEVNRCACRCVAPLVMNASGTGCVNPPPVAAPGTPGNRAEAIVQIVLLGEAGQMSDIPGWDDLSRDEQRNLETLVEAIRVTMGLSQQPPAEVQSPYPAGHPCEGLPGPEACSLYLSQMDKAALQRWLEANLARRAQEAIDRRSRIQQVIIDEIKGDSKWAFYLPEAITWWGRHEMTAAEIAEDIIQEHLTDEFTESLLGKEPQDLEKAADELVQFLPQASTNPIVDDYYKYREFYQQQINQGLAPDEARRQALEQVRQGIKESYNSLGRLGWLEDGTYARAFDKLDRAFGTGGGE